MAKKNKIARISLAGGLIGLLTTNPRRALDDEIDKHNLSGWNVVNVLPHKTTNAFIAAAQLIVLVVTLGLWTWGAGYLIILEKEAV